MRVSFLLALAACLRAAETAKSGSAKWCFVCQKSHRERCWHAQGAHVFCHKAYKMIRRALWHSDPALPAMKRIVKDLNVLDACGFAINSLDKRPDVRAFVDAAVQLKHLRFRTGPELLVLLALIWNFYWVWLMQAFVEIFLTMGTAIHRPSYQLLWAWWRHLLTMLFKLWFRGLVTHAKQSCHAKKS